MVNNNQIKKSLENDNLYFLEGNKLEFNSPDWYLDIPLFKKEFDKKQRDNAYSNGDFAQDMQDRIDLKDEDFKEAEPGIFEKVDYLKRLFPSKREQKPGKDFYGTTTFILAIMAVFVLNTFDKLFVTPEDLLKGTAGSNNIFSSNMALSLLFVICLIFLERYISRTDTKEIFSKESGLEDEKKSFFNAQKMFKRGNTSRSMTVKLKTMKTGDMDFTGDES